MRVSLSLKLRESRCASEYSGAVIYKSALASAANITGSLERKEKSSNVSFLSCCNHSYN